MMAYPRIILIWLLVQLSSGHVNGEITASASPDDVAVGGALNVSCSVNEDIGSSGIVVLYPPWAASSLNASESCAVLETNSTDSACKVENSCDQAAYVIYECTADAEGAVLSIAVSATAETDLGNWTCSVLLADSEDQETDVVLVSATTPDDNQQDESSEDPVTIELAEDTVAVGETVRLDCNVSEEAAPLADSGFVWYKDAEVIAETDEGSMYLDVENVTQAGNYSCSISDGDSPITSSEKHLAVSAPPTLLSPIFDTTVTWLYGHKHTPVVCTASGQPPLTEADFTWLHDGEDIDNVTSPMGHNTAISENSSSSAPYGMEKEWSSAVSMVTVGLDELTCDLVVIYDGVYMCRVGNDSSGDILLETQYPAIWNGTSDRTVGASEGDSVTLTCDVCVNPPGEFTWEYNSESLSSDNVDSDTVSLSSVESSDFGDYTCTVTNTIDDKDYEQTFTITLARRGSPETPADLTVTDVTSNSVSLSWKAGSNGHFKNAAYNVTYTAVNSTEGTGSQVLDLDDMIEGQDVNMTVTGLSNSTLYQFNVTAWNEFDGGMSSEAATLSERTDEPPVVNLTSVNLTENAVMVTWEVLEGDVKTLSLGHKEVRSKRALTDEIDGYAIISADIDPTLGSVTASGTFDLENEHQFALFAYEGLNAEPSTSTADDDDVTGVVEGSGGKSRGKSRFVVKTFVLSMCVLFLIIVLSAAAVRHGCAKDTGPRYVDLNPPENPAFNANDEEDEEMDILPPYTDSYGSVK